MLSNFCLLEKQINELWNYRGEDWDSKRWMCSVFLYSCEEPSYSSWLAQEKYFIRF